MATPQFPAAPSGQKTPPRTVPRAVFVLLAGIVFGIVSCRHGPMLPSGDPPELPGPVRLASELELASVSPENFADLANVYRLSANLLTGGEPAGKTGLERLAAMGARTIISVDGKTPDVAAAAARGLRYVHIPIRYTGVTDEEILRVVKTFRELEAPFYVHCSQGHHRGPTVAAIGRLVLDGVSRRRALAEMRQWCRTSPRYEGLYRAVAEARLPSVEETRSYAWGFPAVQPLGGLRGFMASVSGSHDHLRRLRRRQWATDPSNPDVVGVDEAEKLVDLFTRAEGMAEIRAHEARFRAWTEESTSTSRELLQFLRAVQSGRADAGAAARSALDRLETVCDSCHRAFR